MNRTKRSLYTTVLAVGLLAIATACNPLELCFQPRVMVGDIHGNTSVAMMTRNRAEPRSRVVLAEPTSA